MLTLFGVIHFKAESGFSSRPLDDGQAATGGIKAIRQGLQKFFVPGVCVRALRAMW